MGCAHVRSRLVGNSLRDVSSEAVAFLSYELEMQLKMMRKWIIMCLQLSVVCRIRWGCRMLAGDGP
jgi:hypothetical protein